MELTAKSLVPNGAPLPFSAAVFDFDGTIAESYHVWKLVDKTFLDRRGLPYPDDLSANLAARGFRGGAAWLIERFGLPETVDEVCDEWNALGSELYQQQVRLRPGAKEYVEALRAAGVACALATNNDPDVLQALKPHVDVDALFDLCVYGAEVGTDKHSPDIYLEAARRLGVPADRCAVFEDIPYGLAAAKGAGMGAVAVRSADPKQDMEAIEREADLVIDGFDSLGTGADESVMARGCL